MDALIHDFEHGSGAQDSNARYHLQLDARPLRDLLDDAECGLRLAELLQIERPSDVLPYLWLRELESPQPFRGILERMRGERSEWDQRERPWSERCVPLSGLDPEIRSNCDEETWETVWLSFRSSQPVRDFLVHVLGWLRGETAARLSSVPLFQHIQTLWHSGQHGELFVPRESLRTPVVDRDRIDQSWPAEAALPAGVARTFERLMRDPEVVAVSIRDQDRPELVFQMAAEQRRRADATGHPPALALHASALGYPVELNTTWDSLIWFFTEGLAECDLLVHLRLAPREDGKPQAVGPRADRYVLCLEDVGELRGFVGQPGEDCWVYERIDPPSRREGLRRTEMRRASTDWGRVADFGLPGAVLFGWERTLIVAGSGLPATEREALQRLLSVWKAHAIQPALWIEDATGWMPELPHLLNTGGEGESPALSRITDWLESACPWLDVVLLLEPSPAQVEALTARLAAQQDPWPAHVIATGEIARLRIDTGLPAALSGLLDEAFERVPPYLRVPSEESSE